MQSKFTEFEANILGSFEPTHNPYDEYIVYPFKYVDAYMQH
jgi:hypothetical protein